MSLLDYCKNDRQREVIELYEQGYRSLDIGKQIGITDSSARRTVRKVKGYGLNKGYNPDWGMNEPYPGGHQFTHATVHRRGGEVIEVWDRMKKVPESVFKTAQSIADSFTHNTQPLPRIAPPTSRQADKDIIPWYQLGDAHIGMVAYQSQVNEKFDLDIAKKMIQTAVQELIDQTPPCERCVINDIGDGVHYDNESGKTPKNGHDLDMAGCTADVLAVYSEAIRYIIESAARKHRNVDVIINQGNHNPIHALVMALELRWFYKENPRITILDNRNLFIPYRMGNTFVMCHHGHTVKPGKLPGVMASDYRQDFGETQYHYIDKGHVHHGAAYIDHSQATEESFNIITPNDKHAHDAGYRSRRFLSCLMRSKTYGEKGRFRKTAEEIIDKIEGLAPGTTADRRLTVHTV